MIYTIIVTYNGKHWIDNCLCSLLKSTVNQKIIVVDNASSDGTPDHIRKRYRQVELIENSENLGFGAANNQGILHALNSNADYVMLLNQDVYVHEDTIEKLLLIFPLLPDAGILSPLHLNGNASGLDNNFGIILKSLKMDIFVDSLLGQIKSYYEISYVNAAAWFLSKKTIEKIGLFDPLFYHYGEDDNFSHRMLYHKLKLFIIPGAKIEHDRTIYGNEKVFKKGQVERTLTAYYANINYSLISFRKELTMTHLRNAIDFILSLFTLKWSKSIDILSGYFHFILKLPEIIQSRKRNKV